MTRKYMQIVTVRNGQEND